MKRLLDLNAPSIIVQNEKRMLQEAVDACDKRDQYGQEFQAAMGAEAIKKLLDNVDLDGEVAQLKEDLKTAQGQKRTRAVRRLDILEAFRSSGNQPGWMVMDVIPVIPPDLRPMVQLEGGRFATSDLNDLYRRVIDPSNFTSTADIILEPKRAVQECRNFESMDDLTNDIYLWASI